MQATCPSCHATFTPAVPIAGARCPACLARDEQVIAVDRVIGPQLRRGPGWLELARVPPQPVSMFLGALLGVAVALTIGVGFVLSTHLRLPLLQQVRQMLTLSASVGAFGGLVVVYRLVPLAFPLSLRIADGQVQLGSHGNTFRVRYRVPANEVARLDARKTAGGFRLVAKLISGEELVLAAGLHRPDDAMRLAMALREALPTPASDSVLVGTRELEPGPADAHDELGFSDTGRGVQLQLRGFMAARIEADDDGLVILRPLRGAQKLLADDVLALRAEEHVARADGRPRYRVIVELRRGRCVVADDLRSPEAARFLRDALARALRM